MTPQEHLDRAEHLLEQVRTGQANWNDAAALEAGVEAIGHALVALAIETGAPHPAVAGGASSGP